MRVTLRDKFYGCICGAHIGSSMGAVVEGMNYQEIEEKYGTLDALYPYEHYNNGWMREAGTTEDGIERQKLMITAIMEKGDRVTAEDIRAIWLRDIKPGAPNGVSEAFEGKLLAMAKSGIPARDIGKYCDYAGLNSMARACHPIGLINAGDVRGAIEDVYEVGQLYQTTNSRGLKWACVTGIGIAAATKPGATVDSVIEEIFANLDERLEEDGRDEGWSSDYSNVNIVDEIKSGLEVTKSCKDFRELREAFDALYSGHGMTYAHSYANEVVTKGICIFKMTGGNPKEAIIAAVNFGRDTDCVAAVAGGLSGALTGAASIPEEWINQVDYAVKQNKLTNTQRTLRENADGLYNAYKNRLNKMRKFIDRMDIE